MREIVKDAQDIEGDARFGCRTLPIVIGIPNIRLLVMVLQMITIAGIAWFQYTMHGTGYPLMAWILLAPQLLLIGSVFMTMKARTKESFGRLSLIFKIIMLLGMLSLIGVWFRIV
jgi:4-hydroxybenzoate polyprenyltransferase